MWLAAKIGAVRSFNLTASLEFVLQGPGSFSQSRLSNPGPHGEQRTWHLVDMLPSGHYVWLARTYWGGIRSSAAQAPVGRDGYCFQVAALPFAEDPQPPAAPFDLVVLETAYMPPLPSGLRASSWHPNDRPLKLQFEYKLQNEPWTGQGLLETAYLSRDVTTFSTVAVEGDVLFGHLPMPQGAINVYKWRVRAVDELQASSAWVEGRPFAMYLASGRPTDLREFARFLERIDGRMLDPKGPIHTPRLFVTDQWPADHRPSDPRLGEWTKR